MRALVFLYLLLFSCNISSKGVVHTQLNDTTCKAALVYHEARGESARGRKAVLDVLSYRMQKQGKSCVEVALAYRQYSGFTKKKIYKVEKEALTDYWFLVKLPVVCRECEYYHNKTVYPSWAQKMEGVVVIGNHKFYKERV